jgi:hypothetical protein
MFTKISTKELRQKAQKYIIDSIDSEAYDIGTIDNEEKLFFLAHTFRLEKQWHIDQVGTYKAFQEWIMGLPTVFNIEFENYKIIELAKSWGSIPQDASEKQEDKILENYWNFITSHTFQLFRKYKIEV